MESESNLAHIMIVGLWVISTYMILGWAFIYNQDTLSNKWSEWNPLKKKGDFIMTLPFATFAIMFALVKIT